MRRRSAMQDVKKSEERSQAESLDPAGPPKPVKKDDDIGLLTALGVTVTVFGTLFTVCGLTARPTCGATRSARLQWEERAAQIEQAQAEEQTHRQQDDDAPSVLSETSS
jgi:hypothetical protein